MATIWCKISTMMILMNCLVRSDEGRQGNILYMAMYDRSFPGTYIGFVSANPRSYQSSVELDYEKVYSYDSMYGYNWNALAADYHSKNISFVDTSTHRIFFSDDITSSDGSMAHLITGGTSGRVDAITIDWLAQNVYWADEGYNWIRMSGYGGRSNTLIIDTGLEKPSGIACHPTKGYLFWTEFGGILPARIERSSMSGKDRTVIVDSNLNEPKSIVVDTVTNRIYWIDTNDLDSKIESSDFDGEERRVEVVQLKSTVKFSDISVDENYIFAVVFYPNNLETSIRFYNKSMLDNADYEFNLGTTITVNDITVTGSQVQPIASTLPCDDHICDQFCVSEVGGNFECLCRDNNMVLPNGTCIYDSNFVHTPFCAIGMTNALSSFDPILLHYDLKNKEIYINTLLQGSSDITAVTIDVHVNFLFYADYLYESIFVVRLEEGQISIKIVDGIGLVNALVVDWIGLTLYWAEHSRERIVMSSYDGESQNVIVHGIQSSALAVDPNSGFLFWSAGSMTSSSKIVRSDLNGDNQQDIAHTELNGITGIALDRANERIYIASDVDIGIFSLGYDGTEYMKIGESQNPSTDITLYQDFLILAENNIVESIHKTTGIHEGSITFTDSTVKAIETADESVQPIRSVTMLSVESVYTNGPDNTVTSSNGGKKDNMSIIFIVAGGGGGAVLLIILVVIVVACLLAKRSNGHSRAQPNTYVSTIPRPDPIYSTIFESNQPPPYESTIGAVGGKVIESPYMKPKLDHTAEKYKGHIAEFYPMHEQYRSNYY